ncbi:DUF3224 domain-containing protein [Nakamurella antarctica]|uniref:DUF3224 domain-containing protein n=1 Tax=Nakamurella antarctica TaxID=1902245 RepID=A0A3G8ZK08_9ACTN|nr:DUF3224 domain-containing protein [Nakamurella antarctica]AZI57679.1 DUF3224 domain-containing protein [Nakamurella antarctica]
MTHRLQATCAFEIQQSDSAPDEWAGGMLGHTRWEKQFVGALNGNSVVEAVYCMVTDGPAIYVAIERFDCELDGRTGTFVLTHRASTLDDVQQAEWRIVEGSGTGELAGITGSGRITDDHQLILDYQLS